MADASVKVAVRVRPYIDDDYYAKQEARECIIRMDKLVSIATIAGHLLIS